MDTPEYKGRDEMLQQIWSELRYVRQKLDDHVQANEASVTRLKEDMSAIKSELSGHKVKLGLMFSGIGIIMSGIVAWLVDLADRVN